MTFETARLTALVTADLMKIKGRGVELKCRTDTPALDKLARIEQDFDSVTAGEILLHYLEASIESLPERLYGFEGKRHAPNKMKAAFYLALRIGTTAKHEARSYRIMGLLGLPYTYDQWRKEPRLERGLLKILAEHIVVQSNVPTV